MIALDASVLIAHLNPVDTHHDAATRILLAASTESPLVHTITLVEVLVGGVRIGRGAQMHADLRATSGLKLPDCCVLDTAISNDASLATFDDALAMVARQRGVAVLA